MKLLSCLILFAVVAMAQGGKPYYNVNEAPAWFEKFIKDYNRNYKDEADKDAHFQAFVQSLTHINRANAESPSAAFDINNFADYTPEERKQMFGLRLEKDKK